MQPIILKTTKPINYDGKLKEYLIKNYDAELPENIKNFIGELQQNQSVLNKMGEVAPNLDTLKVNREIVLNYINQLNLLRQKMSFGKENFSIKIEFIWKDIFKRSKWTSYNINFELYNAMFNLATIHYLIAYHMEKDNNNEESYLKEITTNYRNAMAIFDLIKNEIAQKIPQKEIPYDLETSYLEYCCKLCEIHGQLNLIKMANQKNTKLDLIAKLTLGVSNLYKEAAGYFNSDILKKYVDNDFKNFLLNRSNYYYGQMFLRYFDNEMKKFNEIGEGYGHAIAYLFNAVEQFQECSKNAKKLTKFIDVFELEKLVEKLTNQGKEMFDKNERIYRSLIPDLKDAKYESKKMITPLMPNDLFKTQFNLDSLVPREVKLMIQNYKEKLMNFITEKLNSSETPDTIDNFINNFNLPKKFTVGSEENEKVSYEIPNDLWNKICQVQQLGGTVQLSSTIEGIMHKTGEMLYRLDQGLQMLSNEVAEDNKYRQRFQNQWIRKTSNELNINYVNTIQKYIANLHQTKQYDLKEKDDIVNNIKNFEMLSLPKEVLNEKIPASKTEKPKPLTKDEQSVRDSVQTLLKLKDECFKIINPIFEKLNDESQIVQSFVDVLAKKTTEQAIFEMSKSEYELKFVELEKLSDIIKKDKNTLEENIHKIANELAQPQKPEQYPKEVNDFFKQLFNYCNLYMQKSEKLRKGKDYYTGLEMKINDVLNATNQFVQKRESEKEALIQSITGLSYNIFINQSRGGGGGGNNPGNNKAYGNQEDFLDPTKNLYTNIGIKGYNYGNQNYNNKNTGYNNQNKNNNMNNNMYNNMNNNMNNNMQNQNPHPFRTQQFNGNNNQNMGQGFNNNNNNNFPK